MSIRLDQIVNMPAFAPYYANPPARYRNVKFQFVDFRADVSAWNACCPSVSNRMRMDTVLPSD
ncbi:MAG: hypothetical protein CM1200mP2_49830 [Planctomycetaceae bacterium]|nr:MAG: hypothetical protein CM1200mP2_49830 [Planctomycetaceae bacterium]